MRIVFMGTPDIAAACLEKLLTEHMNVVAVYTKPDTPQNRGMKLTQSPVKRVALAHEIPVYQPAGFREAAAVEELRALKPDVIAVVAYGRILPQVVLDIPPRGCINTSKAVYTEAGMVNSGYSDCTLRITYAATVNSDASVVYGDAGNPNEVVLTWKRTSSDFYDTLVDDAHVYTYGLELTKLFSDGKGDFSKVEFILHNDTDDYFVKAELNEAEGIYYVVDHVEAEADATHFIPMSADPNKGKIVVKGLEDDTYTITEVRTDNGYTLLKDDIEVVISQAETTKICDIYASDVLGLIQNDPRYATIIHDTGDLKNMPQRHLEHHLLTASATVDGNAVTMLTDNGSANAEAPLRVVNTRGFDLPRTGDNGTKMLTIAGTLLILCAGGCVVILIASKRKKNAKQ